MKVSAKNAIILVGGYNLSTYFTTYEVAENAAPIDVTGFTDGSNNYIPGLMSGSITGNAIWDNTTDTSYPVLKSYTGTTTDGSVTILPEGGTAGYPSISLPFTQGGITPSGSPSGAIMLGNMQFSSYGDNEGVENGILIHHGAITASTTDADVTWPDCDGAVTARCSGTLHIWRACASDTYAVKIRHCATSDGVYADLVTFTLTGAALGSERVEVASGTINKFLQFQATRTGVAGDSFGCSVHFWREPNVTT
jgi:hypothetical protein